MSEYRQQLKTFGYKNNPFKKDGKNFTRAFNKFVRENPRTPLPKDKIYNPITKRIVLKSSVLDRRYKDKEVLKPKLSTKGSTYKGKKTEGKGLFLDKDGFISDYLIETKKKLTKTYLNPEYNFSIDLNKLPNKDIRTFLPLVRTNAPLLLKTKSSYGTPAVYYTLNDMSNKRLFGDDLQNQTDSDAEFLQTISLVDTFEVQMVKEPDTGYTKNNFGFFPYTIKENILGLDLNRYGVYHEINKRNYRQNCLIKALNICENIDKKIVDKVKFKVKSLYIPKKDLKSLAENNNIHISLKIDGDTKNTYRYGDKNLPENALGGIEKHFIKIEKTKYTAYGIKNYKDLVKTNPKDWYLFTSKGKKEKGRGLDSFKLIKLLLENKDTFLEPITLCNELFNTQYDKTINQEFPEVLHLDDDEFRPVRDKEKEKKAKDYKDEIRAKTKKIYFDFETDTTKEDKIHTPYLCWYVERNEENKGWTRYQFLGEKCGLNLLKHLHDRFSDNGETIVKMIAHNCGYDFRTGIFKYLCCVKTIEKGKSLMCGEGKFYNFSKNFVDLRFTDSYAIIPVGLKKFSKMFSLPCKKEILPYSLYTTKNIKKKFVEVNTCLAQVKPKDHKEYLQNCKNWNCILTDEGKDYIDIISYSSKYCEMDCITLAEGYEKFRKIIFEITEKNPIDIDDYISLASIADTYLKKSGCYDDCYELGGIVRCFIQRCLVGGRTMLNNNKKYTSSRSQGDFKKLNKYRKNLKNKNYRSNYGKIADYDAVSLYPSAMSRLEGYLKGSPKVIENDKLNKIINKENVKDWITADGYYIKTKIKKVGIKRDFPSLSHTNEDGIRIFSNDVIGKEIYLDNVALEDAIKFQDVEVEILQGYYFDGGFNTKVAETIKGLFNARIKAKKEKNEGLQNTIKLIMNSSYGKTALKEINEEIDYISNEKFNDYIYKNYNFIKDITPQENDKGYRIKKIKPINEHFNRVHIGIQVLSMSKRIMNEVMCLAEDNNLLLFYQDTDSIHLYEDDVKILEDNFREIYNRELNGKNLGQFHIDFDLDDCKDVYSEKFIGLGKKSYIDCLVGTDIKTGEIKRGYHIRMKGIPNGSILYYCKENNITPLELYEKLEDDEDIVFDLLKDLDGDKVVFEYKKDMTIHTATEFKREVCFRDETPKERKERRKLRDSINLN